MKKVLSLLLATVMLFNLTACGKNETYTAEQVRDIVAPYMRDLSIGLSDNWCGSKDDKLLTAVGGDIFKAMLESIWRRDNGTEIYNENYKVKLEDYVIVATEYFAYDKGYLTEHFKADDSYNSAEETLLSADGLGSVIGMEVASVEQQGGIFKVNYDCYGPDGYYAADYGYLTVKINKNGRPKFLSNVRNYSEQEIKTRVEYYAPAGMLEYSWDENFSTESIENNMILLDAALKSMYYNDYNQRIYDDVFRIKIADLVQTAKRHFTFDATLVRDFYESFESYDADKDTVIDADGYGIARWISNAVVTKNGDTYTVNYDSGVFDQQAVKDFGTMAVKVSPSGHIVFLSNTVNASVQENPQIQSQPQVTAPAFERVFDTWDDEGICQELIHMFCLCAYDDWYYNYEDALLNCGKGTGLPDYINTLYGFDTGKNLIDKDGYAHIDDMVKYGVKYFDVNESILRKNFERHPNYNSADGTILFDGGIGSVTGVQYIETTERKHEGTVYYDIDYAITDPDDPQYRYAKLTYTKNEDGSFKFVRNKYYGERFYPSYDLKQYIDGEAVANSKDGRYALYWGDGFGAGDSSSREIVLCDTQDNSCTSLGVIIKDQVSDAGFFANGDAYTMDYTGLNVFRTSAEGGGRGEVIFTTKTNFPGGVVVDDGPYSRYIFAIRRDPVTYEYIVIYGDCIYSDPANDFQLKENYRVGLLDKTGKLTKSWETRAPIMFTAFGFESVYMTKPNEAEIEFFVQYKTEERFRGRFNLENGEYTTIKEFVAP
ncbi:MAG: hypothetical protein J6C76_08670 [Oscillospiraceae bacterium]|nr:hypothetical protein [Oscillospiraceae bacterium]